MAKAKELKGAKYDSTMKPTMDKMKKMKPMIAIEIEVGKGKKSKGKGKDC